MIAITTSSILAFISKTIIGHEIKKKWDKTTKGNADKFHTTLANIIHYCITKYDAEDKFEDDIKKHAFYKDEIFIIELLEFRYYKNDEFNCNEIIEKLNKNPHVFNTSCEEIESFTKLFQEKIEKDTSLKELEKEFKYKEAIFEIYDAVNELKSSINKKLGKNNTITVDGNGNIIIQDAKTRDVIINISSNETKENIQASISKLNEIDNILQKLTNQEVAQEEILNILQNNIELKNNILELTQEGIEKINEIKRKIDTLFDDYQQKHKFELYVISTTNRATNESNFQEIKSIFPKQHYGNEVQDWKPFNPKQETIKQLITEYKKFNHFVIKDEYIDILETKNISDEDLSNILSIRNNVILILDGLSVHFDKTNKLIEKFNLYEIGGCLIPVFEDYPQNIKKKIKELTASIIGNLNDYFYKIFNSAHIHIELYIPTKEVFFRRLTNTAISKNKKPKIAPYKTIAILKDKTNNKIPALTN